MVSHSTSCCNLTTLVSGQNLNSTNVNIAPFVKTYFWQNNCTSLLSCIYKFRSSTLTNIRTYSPKFTLEHHGGDEPAARIGRKCQCAHSISLVFQTFLIFQSLHLSESFICNTGVKISWK